MPAALPGPPQPLVPPSPLRLLARARSARVRAAGSMARRAALLAVALALTVASLPAVHAVTCQSFTSPATCEATTTSSGKCGWRDSVCIPVAPLPPGKVAITSLPTLGTLPALAMEPVAMPAAEDLAAPEEAGKRRKQL